MKFYADDGPRRARQLILDAVVALWCLLWISLGAYVNSSFDSAKHGAQGLESSGTSLSQHLGDAGGFVSDLPIGGDKLQEPFDQAAAAARSMSTAGHDLGSGLGRLALLLGFLTAISPLFCALLPWSLLRMRYARRAGRLARLRSLPGGEKLLALEALGHARPRRLAAISDDPVGDWQAADTQVTRRLADLALSTYGIRRKSMSGDAGHRADVHSTAAAKNRSSMPDSSMPDESSARTPSVSATKRRETRQRRPEAPWAAHKNDEHHNIEHKQSDDEDTHWA